MSNSVLAAPDAAPTKLLAPGPRTLNSLRSGLRYMKEPFPVLEGATRRYGPIVRFPLPNKQVVHLIYKPEHLQHVLLDNNRNYEKCSPFGLLKLLFGRGLLFNEGPSWFSQRRLMQPAFQPAHVSVLADETGQAIVETVARWSDGQDGAQADLEVEMGNLARRIVGQVLFGANLTDDINDLLQSDESKFSFLLGNLPFTPQNLHLKASISKLDKAVYGIIAERRQNPERATADVVGALMRAVDKDSREVMDDKQLRDEIVTLLFSGFDTTSRTLSWIFHALSQHPEVEAQLHEELDRVLEGRAPTYADLPQLPYTTMLVKETMRVFPANPIIGRQAKADDTIGGYHIPAGSLITLSPYLAHHDPELWENVKDFEPQRWAAECEIPGRFAYLPFGGGPRQCIGKGLAMMTIPLAAATIAQRYRFCPLPDFKVEHDIKVTFQSRRGILTTRHLRPAFEA